MMMNNQVNNLVIIRLYHAFNSDENYQYRGLLTIQNNVPIIKQDSINDEQLKLLQESSKNGDNYYLKAEAYQTLVFEHEKPYQISKTFIPACALLESSLNDQLWISLDVNSRFVYLMANIPNVYCTSSSSLQSSFDNLSSKSFNTTVLYSKTVISAGADDPDKHRTLNELIESRGFEVEEHSIETNDGYILLAHRIVWPKNSSINQKDLKPVLVQHGLFGASSDFCINSPFLRTKQSKYGDTIAFALMLTRKYDVWLANSRGNRYSRRHRTRSPSNRNFWQFTWDHMATEDLPATINYVRNATERKTIAYIGWSQGTAIMFTLMSLQPEYADIIQPFIALAPITFVKDIESPMRYFSPMEPLLKIIGGEFIPSNALVENLVDKFCQYSDIRPLCADLIFLFGGFDRKNLNETRIGVYLHFTPSTTSTWDVAHWAQLVNRGRFQRFDYGSAARNQKHYNQSTAPDIPLENIPPQAKIALYQGHNDVLSTELNLNLLKNIFKKSGVKLIRDFYISDPKWTHLDFSFGENAGKFFINDMIDTLNQYAK
uniref:Gastric triacylglycerol lipase-like n=1 Tax=Dermatophagoides pteronyssinus TaxID=6956 RepID=A0A6P6Y9Z0_DERPT|nr:gastric triacylglycerol lipase-like [Dermatophagoides pteronyssinus]